MWYLFINVSNQFLPFIRSLLELCCHMMTFHVQCPPSPLPPQQISCRTLLSFAKDFFFFFNSVPLSVIYQFLSFLPSLSEDKVWTTVYHDLQMQTAMGGNSPDKFSVLQLNYSATMDQISAITSSAEYCEQFISYSCKMSRLLNTPGRLRMGYPLNTVLKSFISTI